MLDKEYLKYLANEGKIKPEDMILEYLEYICTLLEARTEKDELVGQYKIQPQTHKGYPKGPPSSFIS